MKSAIFNVKNARGSWLLRYIRYLRLVHTDRVKRSSIGQFLRMRKSCSVRKFSILLRKRMRFTQV